MKKVLLIALTLSLLLSSVAFATPSVGYVFSVYENDNVFYYMFGSTEKDIDEVGVTINGKDYNLGEDALEKAKTSGKFGIGIADPKNILGASFEATPYNVSGETRSQGTVKGVTKSEVPDEDVIALNSLTIDGKAVAGFYTGTTETDFYYGLEEITSIESIPEVSYTLSMGEAETSLTEEKGGFVYTISASKDGRDGIVKNTEFKVHFREFAEKTVAVKPDSAYRVRYSYSETLAQLFDLKSQSGLNIATNTVEDYTSQDNVYLYFTYDVEEDEKYAPVSFDLVGLKARWNPLNIYVYDGDLSKVEFPATLEEANEEKNYIFNGYKGLNYSDSFHLVRCAVEKDQVWTQIGTVASSTAVSEGKNILILKSEYPQIGSNPSYIIYGDWAGCYMTMNVKYVEKNPKDETDIDATIASLKIKGEDADGVKDDTYYKAVEDLTSNDGITKEDIVVTTNTDGATYEVSEIADNQAIVTVTAKDGETTKEYTVKFKEMISQELSFISKNANQPAIEYLLYKNGAYEAGTVGSNNFFARCSSDTNTVDSRAVYFDYSTADLPENSIMVGTATINTTAERTSTYNFYNSSYERITKDCTFDEFTIDSPKFLGSHQRTIQNNASVISITFDSSKLDIKNGGYIKIALEDGDDNGSVSMFGSIPTLTVNYITLD